MSLRSLLGSEVVVLDGSMGAFLQSRGLPPGTAPDLWNLQRPGAVQAAHRLYVEAGAQVVLTNTFGGTRPRLDAHGAGDQVEAINRAAVRNARQAGARFVAGDIGPSGLSLEPAGDLADVLRVTRYGQPVAGVVTQPSGAQVRWTPSAALSPGSYRATVSQVSSALGAESADLQRPFEWSFTVE